ncbi:MAG: hypothetical protein LJF06_13285 [Gemmatimonadetes bacterium]|nr:hypothetical protein [Gemmatimonadota bacterium]
MSNVPGDGSAEPEPPPAFEPVEYRDSLPVYLVWLVAMVVLTVCAVAFWPTWGPTPLLVFGSAAVAAALRVLRRRVRLRITEEGIIDRTGWYSPGLIPWEDVVDVRPGPWGYVQLDLTEASSFWERQTPLRQLHMMSAQLWGLSPATISSLGLAASRRTILRAMEVGMDRHALASLRREAELPPGEDAGGGSAAL